MPPDESGGIEYFRVSGGARLLNLCNTVGYGGIYVNCFECGKKVPKGRRYTCSYNCKASQDQNAKEVYRNIQRRREQREQGEKAMSRLDSALNWLGIKQ